MDQSPLTEPENPSSRSEKKYWAFISYSSKDVKWGKWLHSRLESYPIPKEFQGTELFDGAVLGKDLKPCFRDRDELSGSSDLGPAIQKAINQSRYLIVLCSKNSAKSEWVNKEIEDFKSIGGEKNILALILDGVPNASTNPDLPDSEECFPPALRYPAEPLAGDMRKEGDGKERGFLKVLSGIAQLDFDVLYRRHERAQRKKRLVLSAIAASIMLSLTGLSIYAFQQRNFALGEQKRAEAARMKAEASELREREAKEKSLALLKTVRSSLNFMNFELREVMIKYVPVRERTAVIYQVDTLLESLKDLPEETLEKDEPDSDDLSLRVVSLLNKGDLIMNTSTHDSAAALTVYTEALQIAEQNVTLAPNNTNFRDLSVSHTKLGNLHLRLGETSAALSHYEEGMKIVEKLVAHKPNQTLFQRDLTVYHDKLGDLRLSLGESTAALSHFEEGMKFAEKLVAFQPDNMEFQRDLSVAHYNMGELRLRFSETAAAREHFRESMKLRRKLVSLDSNNTEFQRDLAVLCNKLGDISLGIGDNASALRYYEEALKLRKKLVKLDPSNTQFQRDLSICQDKMGDVRLRLKEFPIAINHFKNGLLLTEKLVMLDPDNAQSLCDLIYAHYKLGDLRLRRGQSAGALGHFQEGIKLTEKLVRLDPGNLEFQRNFGIFRAKLGDLRFLLGETAKALGHYEEVMKLAQRQVTLDPTNEEYQRDLYIAHRKLGGTFSHDNIAEYAKASAQFKAAIAVLEGMKKKGTLAPGDEQYIPFLKSEIEKMAAME
ncbi:MAG: TIR domain-containing protein [Luteolibacter sp.]